MSHDWDWRRSKWWGVKGVQAGFSKLVKDLLAFLGRVERLNGVYRVEFEIAGEGREDEVVHLAPPSILRSWATSVIPQLVRFVGV